MPDPLTGSGPPGASLSACHLPVSGVKQASAERLVAARSEAPFNSADDLARRADIDLSEMRLLAGADALASLSGHRRQQVWDALGLKRAPTLLRNAPIDEPFLELPAALEGEEVVHDYATTGLTLRSHPLALLRPHVARRRLRTAATSMNCRTGASCAMPASSPFASNPRLRTAPSSSVWKTRLLKSKSSSRSH